MTYSPFRHIPHVFRKTRPIHFTFFVTRRCNSRCPFCFYLKSRRSASGPGNELTVPEIERVSASLGDLLWLAFSGGEIFLREDLAEIVDIFYRNNRPAIMLFPTNGLLPDVIRDRMERILRSCPNSVVALKLSLDGIEEAHDRLRDTPGSFRKIMETYREVSGLVDRYPNFELGVNTVFSAGNQDCMDTIIEYVRQLPAVRTHTISLVRGNLADERHSAVDVGKYCAAVDRLERNLKQGTTPIYRFRGARIKAAQDILQRKIIQETLLERAKPIECYAGRLNLVMTETGDLYPCELLHAPLGNVRAVGGDVNAILASGKVREVRRSIVRTGCSCTHECYLMTNILFNPRMYPSLLKEYLAIKG